MNNARRCGAEQRASGTTGKRTPLGLSVLALLICAPVVIVAIGTLGAGATTTPTTPAKATRTGIAASCTRVADVLSDGPDPDADPVGYALAQVLPLRRISTTDITLKKDIDTLASAYETVYKTNDNKSAYDAVDKAGKELDEICPRAF
ncbi:MAG TPA: hypothetical protein VME46_05785 [Acidimicrobiales bacterium]|nr:hypothetical protein [Acidimicrobiales bacterium]